MNFSGKIAPELHSLHSPDLLDMQGLLPTNRNNFCILVQAMVGPKGGIGKESFDLEVYTPAWLTDYLASKKKFLFGKHYLVVSSYDYYVIWNAIESLCNSISGASWQEVASFLNRYGKWEFEDHKFIEY